MQNMGFYGHLEYITNKMAGLLLTNQEFIKYLQYDDDDPLSHPDISQDELGKTIDKLKDTRFFLQPKPSKISWQSGVYVEMFLSRDNPERRSGGLFTSYIITFNIICHLDKWTIKNGIRPYRIMNIIDYTFNGANIKDISFDEIRPLGSQFLKFADNFEGYRLGYVLTWKGNKDC